MTDQPILDQELYDAEKKHLEEEITRYFKAFSKCRDKVQKKKLCHQFNILAGLYAKRYMGKEK